MNVAEIETKKRLELAQKKVDEFRDCAVGVVIAGSVAYSPNISVTAQSDLDLIIVAENIKDLAGRIIDDEREVAALKNRPFEAYCVKSQEEEVDVSLHVITADAFDIISKGFVDDIRVYREVEKEGTYNLRGFSGQSYEYRIKNIDLGELKGVRTIVPISFIHDDRYFIGIHRDKLLSEPRILLEKQGYISKKLDKLWHTVTENLYSEAIRLNGSIDLDKFNVLNALAKRERMSEEVIRAIEDKTMFYVAQIK